MFPQIFGKYVLERELASGGMARVYLATLRGAVGFEKRLVVKQIRPELALDEAFVKRFVEEAKIAVELSHPNIVPVYELGVELGVYYIAMELCEGLTLTEVLLETGPLDAAEGALVGVEICRALDYAHRRGGIVHRDVTPRNVLLDEEGAVRLIDFGIAAPVTAGHTQRIEVFGSPGHMPPEQIRGERLTPATDVFAVGALLIEAWTGRAPFRRGTFEASAEALNEPLPSLASARPELEQVAEIVRQSVLQSPDQRPQDAEILGRKLREFARQFDSGDVAKRLGGRVRRALRRSPSSAPWLVAESGPLTPAASPQALLSSRPPPGALAPPPLAPATPASSVTRTFAARNDLVEWTRKLSSIPPEADAAAASASGGGGATLAGEGAATRALPRSKAPPPAPERRPFRWLVTGASAALLAFVAWLGLRPGRPPLEQPKPRAQEAQAPATSPPAAKAAPAREDDVVALPPASASSLPARSSVSLKSATSAAAVTSPASSSVVAERASAELKLTADPPATVTVVGGAVSQTWVTPVRALKLAPGAYSVTFRSATFGDPVAARVELLPGSIRAVHADFRAAVPKVVVR